MNEVVGSVNQAVIKVAVIKAQDGSRLKFEDASGKTFNCNRKPLLGNASDGKPVFFPGRVLKVTYNLVPQKDPSRKPMRWVESVALPADGEPTTWPDRDDAGGATGRYQRPQRRDEWRSPEQIMRSTALGVAVSYAEGRDMSADDVIALADRFFAYVAGSAERDPLGEAVESAVEKLDAQVLDSDEDIPF